jgi:hypothetical protein
LFFINLIHDTNEIGSIILCYFPFFKIIIDLMHEDHLGIYHLNIHLIEDYMGRNHNGNFQIQFDTLISLIIYLSCCIDFGCQLACEDYISNIYWEPQQLDQNPSCLLPNKMQVHPQLLHETPYKFIRVEYCNHSYVHRRYQHNLIAISSVKI